MASGTVAGIAAHPADAVITAKSFDKLIARLLATSGADRGEDGKSQRRL
jgi:hypothetical protein